MSRKLKEVAENVRSHVAVESLNILESNDKILVRLKCTHLPSELREYIDDGYARITYVRESRPKKFEIQEWK